MKECHWCKEHRPDTEEGDIELDPDTNREIGWVCNHCVLRFDGKCDCVGCKEDDAECKEYIRNIKHPAQGLVIGMLNWFKKKVCPA